MERTSSSAKAPAKKGRAGLKTSGGVIQNLFNYLIPEPSPEDSGYANSVPAVAAAPDTVQDAPAQV